MDLLRVLAVLLGSLVAVGFAGCTSDNADDEAVATEASEVEERGEAEAPPAVAETEAKKADAREPGKQLLWGDTHLHTNYSADAYGNRNTTADPDTAYRFAKGLPVINAYSKGRIQINQPLDFLAVTDHAEYAGMFVMLDREDPAIAQSKEGKRFLQMSRDGKGTDVFFELIGTVNANDPIESLNTKKIRNTVWSELVDAAERHNEPGKFTALIGWEWSSLPNGANLHRVVLTPQDGTVAKQFFPFAAFDSERPEDLWKWLTDTSARTGAEFVAIPHGSNISDGRMFTYTDSDGKPITQAYAQERMKWEPVVEITQIKGDSETHSVLSPDDEFADFETYAHLIKTGEHEGSGPTIKAGDYVRPALNMGLELEEKVGTNPYKFALIGSTDAHSGMASAEEDNFQGKFSLDSTPGTKDLEVVPGVTGWDMSASGLAAVWADENTREAIIAALRRKEVYGTSGPRIQLRFFGSYDFGDADAKSRSLASIGYDKGVPMGADLSAAPAGKPPSFLIQAVKDPIEANLDRIQIVKGWLGPDGKAREKVYDVAWSGERKPGASGKLPPVGNTVDEETASYTNTIGSPELVAVWRDPSFDPNQRAYYYARVLQIPTPRNSLYDSVALQKPHPKNHPSSIQERAYSSPIWYTP